MTSPVIRRGGLTMGEVFAMLAFIALATGMKDAEAFNIIYGRYMQDKDHSSRLDNLNPFFKDTINDE